LEAALLRKEIRAITGTGLPHESVYARLGKSTVDPDGVGVIAIRKISKGTYVFEPDDAKTVQINSHRISDLSPELRKLYYDFCPFRKGKYTAPTSLNKLTVAWYVNWPKPSETPNLACDKELRFYASTDIKPGDELTADYSKYCDPPPEDPDNL